ncbi:hypothetical protein, partial [Heliomicrobium undosum]|uniref:hypothetical protein n=1 Tax=Heliomicrobium undosum TaxID=121734 RepID=UPI001A9B13C3
MTIFLNNCRFRQSFLLPLSSDTLTSDNACASATSSGIDWFRTLLIRNCSIFKDRSGGERFGSLCFAFLFFTALQRRRLLLWHKGEIKASINFFQKALFMILSPLKAFILRKDTSAV